jgi:4-carboxymuconolactone decarboxylase
VQEIDKRPFEERYEDGARIRGELTRGRHPLPEIGTVSDFSKPFRQWMGSHLFNDIWSRPGLGRRERCMLVIAMMAATNRSEIRAYIDMALDVGVTRDEIQEVLLQAVAYCGTLAGVSSFRIAEQVFAERDAQHLDDPKNK